MKKGLVSKLVSLYIAPLKIFSRKSKDFVLTSICSCFDDDSSFVSYRLRPYNPSTDIPVIEGFCEGKSFAIVLQGPICREHQFTIETVKYYRKIYNNAIIIVSTWEDEAAEHIEAMEKVGAVVVQSSKPRKSGILNVNMQLISSLAGIKKAEELGVEYVVKTRTDQRVCKPYVLNVLLSLFAFYKPAENMNIRDRIIVTSTFSENMFTPYYICDFFYFGNIYDMVKLFSCELDNREPFELNHATRGELSSSMYPPEVYIIKHYLKNVLGQTCSDTVQEYWQCLRDYFICMGREDIDLLSTKYEYSRMEHINNSEYMVGDNIERKYLMAFDYCDWHNLYFGLVEYKAEYEKEVNTVVK